MNGRKGYARYLSNNTIAVNTKQAVTDVKVSDQWGEKITRKPWPFINDEKLDTAKGIQNKRKVCQDLKGPLPTLNIKAIPITKLIPKALIQILGLGSK